MAKVQDGDRVRVVTREQTDEDTKSGLYFSHFGGLIGTVQRIYPSGEVAVDVEHESLSKEVRQRHEEVRGQMKTKWLDGLSEEGRSRLTEREKDFTLRYVILVNSKDLEKAGTKPAAAREQKAPAAASDAAEPDAPGAARRTMADIEAAEAAELLRRAQQKTD